MTEERDPAFEALLEHLRDSRNFDFTGYKRSTLMRRVSKRMETIGVDSYTAYLDHLQVHPDEFKELFDYILINVTAFFRDDGIWEYLRTDVIPEIVAGKDRDEPIRVWDAGCASGEEAYTLAILLADALGKEGFTQRVKIYATDADDAALEEARQGAYTAKQVEPVPGDFLGRYFTEGQNGSFVFDKDLRRAVIFGRHDLVQDAPISRVDLLVCRNTLMYFNADVQAKIISNFRFALNETGFLVLGKAEMLFTRVRSFQPVDLKRRVFRPTWPEGTEPTMAAMRRLPSEESDEAQRVAAFETAPIPQLVVGDEGTLVLANLQARRLFRLGYGDLGRPLQDLEVSYRPVELRSRIEQARRQEKALTLENVEWMTPDGERVRLEVQVVPLDGRDGASVGTSITFHDVTRYLRLEDELQTSHQELETAMEELQSTNEELETTNEELQSTNEELETTNEELQSTNEELETMNEELQSTNEELESVNEEARGQTLELNDVNRYLESILASIGAGMAVIDGDLRVEVWNAGAEELWGLRTDEVVGEPILGLDIGLPLDGLGPSLRASLDGSQESIEVDATTRRGKSIRCRVSCSPLRLPDGQISGAIVLMEELDGSMPVG